MNSNPIIKVTAAILEWQGRILIAQRGPGDPLAEKWEFPGGKIESGETPEQCLKRELREELNIDADVGELFGSFRYRESVPAIELVAYRATWVAGEICAREHIDCRWVIPSELERYDFAPADRPFVEKLLSSRR